jgi:hypothetical protein
MVLIVTVIIIMYIIIEFRLKNLSSTYINLEKFRGITTLGYADHKINITIFISTNWFKTYITHTDLDKNYHIRLV